MSHFVNNQTGWVYQTIEHRGLFPSPSGGSELVPQLRHLNEIGLNSSLAAFITKSLGRMYATCAPSNIRYPQDVSLLNEAREKVSPHSSLYLRSKIH